MPYSDDFGRVVNYLRVSVTDRCNLRCVYCMPAEGIAKRPHSDILRFEELALVTRAASELGISRVRITGGEPLARLGLVEFVTLLSSIPGLEDLSLTTNGTLLALHARRLADAGLRRVNISLDTLRPERFAQMTRVGRLDDVWAGISEAQAAGLTPIKFNMVVVRGLNDDEVGVMARRSITHGWHVRFIELMPIGISSEWAGDGVVPIADVRAQIERDLGRIEAVHGPAGNGPARYFRVPGAEGTLGFIGALSDHFCTTCNRLRLTADGRLRPCLMSGTEIDLRDALRPTPDLGLLRERLAGAIRAKPERHLMGQPRTPGSRTMAEIGG